MSCGWYCSWFKFYYGLRLALQLVYCWCHNIILKKYIYSILHCQNNVKSNMQKIIFRSYPRVIEYESPHNFFCVNSIWGNLYVTVLKSYIS